MPYVRTARRPLRILAASAAVWCVLHLAPAHAASATATFQVTATVLNACLVSTPGTLAFGNYSASTAAPGTTAFNVTCTVGTPYSLGLNPRISAGATVTTRKMTSATAPAGNNTLSYGLYKDGAYATNWDDSASGTGYIGTGVAQPYTVYGTVPAGQYSAGAGADYADTVTLTLTY